VGTSQHTGIPASGLGISGTHSGAQQALMVPTLLHCQCIVDFP